MKYSINDIKKNLDSNNFNFKKKFGQNFIIDENIINGIINKSEIDSDSLVIEIGPGAGSLTYKLCKIAKNVLCYEIDDSLKDILTSNLEEYNNVDIIYKDFLVADVKNDIKKYNYSKLYVVANLPYYITTPIISKIITDKIDVDKIVVMVQKEVGDIIEVTRSGIKKNGSVVSGQIFVDGLGVGDVGNIVLRDRKHLSQDGILTVVVTLSKENKTIVAGPDIISRGFVYVRESEGLMDEARDIVRNILLDCEEKKITDWATLKSNVRDELRAYLYEKTKRKPMILPIIMEI